MSPSLKFARSLQILEKHSESSMYYEEIKSVVQTVEQVRPHIILFLNNWPEQNHLQIDSLATAIEFHPDQIFDETKHLVDGAAEKYLEKAAVDVRQLRPVTVSADGNCLYNSILLLMNNPTITAKELRGT